VDAAEGATVELEAFTLLVDSATPCAPGA